MSMFLDNKYSKTYYKIVNRARERNYTRSRYDGWQTHHVIPRCFGGDDSPENLVTLTRKEHRVCHRLLINMTTGANKHKMMHAYKLFNKKYDRAPLPHVYCTTESYEKMAATRKAKGSYKVGKDNIFSTPEIIAIVKERMVENNPMRLPEQRERMMLKNSNPYVRLVEVEGVVFPSLNAAARYYNTTPYFLKKNFSCRFLTGEECYQKTPS